MPTILGKKLEDALVRAFRTHEADSYATDAALVAAVLINQHGDAAGHVLELAAKMANETKGSFEPVPNPLSYAEPDGDLVSSELVDGYRS